MRTLVLAVVVGLLSATAGCSKSAADRAVVEVPTVSVQELDASLAKAAAVPVDANGERTRKRMGIIPGAVLLSEGDDWPISELPADRSRALVFYCANSSCGASHEAAEKAIAAGYRNVKILPDGIAGWVKAGKRAASI